MAPFSMDHIKFFFKCLIDIGYHIDNHILIVTENGLVYNFRKYDPGMGLVGRSYPYISFIIHKYLLLRGAGASHNPVYARLGELSPR